MKLGQTSIRGGMTVAAALVPVISGGCVEEPEPGVLVVHLCWEIPESGGPGAGQQDGGSAEEEADADLDAGVSDASAEDASPEAGGPEADGDAGASDSGSVSSADGGDSARDSTMDGGASAAGDRKALNGGADAENCGTCEQAGVDSYDYVLEDAYGALEAREQLRCKSAIELGRVPGGGYDISIWGYDRDDYLEWEVNCRRIWVDGRDTPEYECYVPGI